MPRAAARPAALSPAGPEPTIAILTLSTADPRSSLLESIDSNAVPIHLFMVVWARRRFD
ncbi:MAG: hypothetical protein DHS20C04_15000 [Hyphococcus sp.]|nr:MAG: hypothetical protein DHS20C04_15000 [Marinicaulis sp.]